VTLPLNMGAFIWASGAFCRLSRIPNDINSFVKKYPLPYDIVKLQRAFQRFGLIDSFKARAHHQLTNVSISCFTIFKLVIKVVTQLPSEGELNFSFITIHKYFPRSLSAIDSIILNNDDTLKYYKQQSLPPQFCQSEPYKASVEWTDKFKDGSLMACKTSRLGRNVFQTINLKKYIQRTALHNAQRLKSYIVFRMNLLCAN